MWKNNRISKLLGIRHPIIQAPMAGCSTPELAIEVSNAGGMGSLAAAMLSTDNLKMQCQLIRKKTNRSFNVPEAVDLPPPFGERHLKIILEENPGVISFHFGLPNQDLVTAIKEAGNIIISSATCVSEAVDLEYRGVDAIVAQGFDAGGHRGTYQGSPETGQIGTMSLIPQIADAINVPIIAAGGIGDGRGIAAAFSLGADGVQMGTAFLRCPETSLNQSYSDALASSKDNSTCITYGFSGRPARAIKNEFTKLMSESKKKLPEFPIPSKLTGKLRAASAKAKTPKYMALWSGQAGSLSTNLPAKQLIKKLIMEVESTLQNLP